MKTTSFKVGMKVQYDQRPLNVGAISRLCVWTDSMISEYQKEIANGKYRCICTIEEIREPDEDEGEPRTFKLKPMTNLENYPEGFIWAVESELSELSSELKR